jgi:hypothetical protein
MEDLFDGRTIDVAIRMSATGAFVSQHDRLIGLHFIFGQQKVPAPQGTRLGFVKPAG